MALLVKDVIATLSTLNPEAACVWQLWTQDHIAEDLTKDEWLAVCKYFNDYSITSQAVGLDELIDETRERRKGFWE
jgi:hypothetical protein